jgi:hypothetical protein
LLEPVHRLRLGVEQEDGRRVHTDMEMWTEIRRKVLVEGALISEGETVTDRPPRTI